MIQYFQKYKPLLIAVFLTALVGCGVGCIIAIKIIYPASQSPYSDGHAWLHDRLKITPEQQSNLEKIEERSENREAQLTASLVAAKTNLGDIIEEEKAYTPRVTAAVEKIHQTMAELQKATVEHLFEMEEVLTPYQFKLLLELAGESLRE